MFNFILPRAFILGLLLISSVSGATNRKGRVIYRAGITYDQSHWALSILKPADPLFIARVRSHEKTYVIKLNPTDARGYRALVALEDPDMVSTLNRPYSLQERLGLNAVLAMCQNMYESFGLIAQVEVLGNNAHVFDPATGDTSIGHVLEPSFLHGHVIGRGDPNYDYIAGVSLRGPMPGELFEHRSNKVNWSTSEIEIVRKALSEQFRLRQPELEKFGVFVRDHAYFAESGAEGECSEVLGGDTEVQK